MSSAEVTEMNTIRLDGFLAALERTCPSSASTAPMAMVCPNKKQQLRRK